MAQRGTIRMTPAEEQQLLARVMKKLHNCEPWPPHLLVMPMTGADGAAIQAKSTAKQLTSSLFGPSAAEQKKVREQIQQQNNMRVLCSGNEDGEGGAGGESEGVVTPVATITLHQVINVPKMDTFGWADPFLEVKGIATQRNYARTVTKWKEKNPVYEQTITVFDEYVKISLWDEDKGPSNNDLIGEIETLDCLAKLTKGKVPFKGKEAKDATLIITVEPYEKPPPEAPQAEKKQSASSNNNDDEPPAKQQQQAPSAPTAAAPKTAADPAKTGSSSSGDGAAAQQQTPTSSSSSAGPARSQPQPQQRAQTTTPSSQEHAAPATEKGSASSSSGSNQQQQQQRPRSASQSATEQQQQQQQRNRSATTADAPVPRVMADQSSSSSSSAANNAATDRPRATTTVIRPTSSQSQSQESAHASPDPKPQQGSSSSAASGSNKPTTTGGGEPDDDVRSAASSSASRSQISQPGAPKMGTEGFLQKFSIGGMFGFGGNWQRRFFILDRFNGLAYYDNDPRDSGSRAIKYGAIPVHSKPCRLVSRPSKKTHKEYTHHDRDFCVVFPDEGGKMKTLLLRASGQSELNRWTAALSAFIPTVDAAEDHPRPAEADDL